MSGPWGGAGELAYPPATLPSRHSDPTLPFSGLSLSTAFSTRTQTGVLCRSRAISLLNEPPPLAQGWLWLSSREQEWCCPSWPRLTRQEVKAMATTTSRETWYPADTAGLQASPSAPGADQALWESEDSTAWPAQGPDSVMCSCPSPSPAPEACIQGKGLHPCACGLGGGWCWVPRLLPALLRPVSHGRPFAEALPAGLVGARLSRTQAPSPSSQQLCSWAPPPYWGPLGQACQVPPPDPFPGTSKTLVLLPRPQVHRQQEPVCGAALQ